MSNFNPAPNDSSDYITEEEMEANSNYGLVEYGMPLEVLEQMYDVVQNQNTRFSRTLAKLIRQKKEEAQIE